MKVIVIGFAACYKTTVGTLLSQKLNCEFFDVDRQIESASGKTVAEIFAVQGEEAFRAAESDVVAALATQQNCVVSCGGGSVLSEKFPLLAKTGEVVWLKGSALAVKSRLTEGTRPLFDGLTTRQLAQKIADREKIYARYANFCVDTDGKTSDAVAEETLKILTEN